MLVFMCYFVINKVLELKKYDCYKLSSHTSVVVVVVVVLVINDDSVINAYACFNDLFEIACDDGEMLTFETVRYGRNDSRVATLCDVPFSWNCDVDVQFLLNRACAGRRRCSVEVGVAMFTDPCGYAEFLTVAYRCVPGI